jgi:hypothetical protein
VSTLLLAKNATLLTVSFSNQIRLVDLHVHSGISRVTGSAIHVLINSNRASNAMEFNVYDVEQQTAN